VVYLVRAYKFLPGNFLRGLQGLGLNLVVVFTLPSLMRHVIFGGHGGWVLMI